METKSDVHLYSKMVHFEEQAGRNARLQEWPESDEHRSQKTFEKEAPAPLQANKENILSPGESKTKPYMHVYL